MLLKDLCAVFVALFQEQCCDPLAGEVVSPLISGIFYSPSPPFVLGNNKDSSVSCVLSSPSAELCKGVSAFPLAFDGDSRCLG